MATDKSNSEVSSDFLIRGPEYLARHPGFTLIGREKELKKTVTALMNKKGNRAGAILVGQNGVGISSIILGIQAGKEEGTVPVQIIGKRFYWLDTDALFSSGDPQEIKQNFKKVMATLKRAPNTVLVLEDVKDFLNGVKDNGVKNLLNILMRELRTNPELQAVIEARDEDLDELLKIHSDMKSYFKVVDVKDPDRKELQLILEGQIDSLKQAHGIDIAPDVVSTLVELAIKYPAVLQEKAAQPQRSLLILEEALTNYLHAAHLRPPQLTEMEARLGLVADIAAGKPGVKIPAEYQGRAPADLEAVGVQLKADIKAAEDKWKARKKSINAIFQEQRKGEEYIARKDEQIERLTAKEEKMAAEAERARKKAGKGQEGNAEFTEELADSGLGCSTEMQRLLDEKDAMDTEVTALSQKYMAAVADVNKGLMLTSDHILAQFSEISGQTVSKLTEDASEKLLNLDKEIKKRLFGQDEVVDEVCDYVKNAGTGLKPENKPVGNFFFIGPTGVGKTEMAKSLAEQLNGDERAMTRFDMSGFKERNSMTVLIGAPPGYEGYDKGGQLTNAVRKKPNSVVLYDEIEKAHEEIVDALLPVFDDGILADSRGLEATFGGITNIMTSNIGAKYFQDPKLTYDEAKEKAMEDVRARFRPEFLARIDGIYFFKNLEEPQIVQIAGKEIKRLAGYLEKKDIVPVMDKEDIEAMCHDNHNKQIGGRGIRNYINKSLKPRITDIILTRGMSKPGKIKLTYNKVSKKPEATFIPKQAAMPINANKAAPAAQTA